MFSDEMMVVRMMKSGYVKKGEDNIFQLTIFLLTDTFYVRFSKTIN